MKQYFTLALSCLALTVVAQPKATMKPVSGMVNSHKVAKSTAMRIDPKTPMFMQQLNGKMDKAFDLSKSKAAQMGPHHAPASAADGVLYRPSSHNLKQGLHYNEADNAWGYNYYTPMLFSQAYKGVYERVEGSSWTIGEADNAIESEWIDGNRNFSMLNAQMGVGGFYTPKIWNKRRASYYYGSDDAEEGSNFTYSVNYKGDVSLVTDPENTLSFALGTYQIYGDMKIYTGWSNTLEFGARDYVAEDGTHVQSDMVVVDYGDLGGGFVLQYLEIPLVTHEKDAPIFEGDEVLDITLIDEDLETGEATKYYATLSAKEVFTDKSGLSLAHVSFVTTDEDGWETSIDPVLNGYVTLVISGFMQEGVNAGLRMVWDNTASEDTYDGGDFGVSHGWYDIWRNGEQRVDEDGNVLLFHTECIEPVLSFIGYFNTFCEYLTGENTITGEVPAEGGMVVTQYGEDGTGYNDYDVESSFDIEYLDILDCPDWVELSYDDEYFEKANVYMFFAEAQPLPAGVDGRQGVIVLGSNGEVTMNLVVNQGNASSIHAIKGDAKNTVSYNLQGQTTEAKSGLMIQDGKVVFVK